MDELDIIYSDDKSLRLTNLRIVLETEERTKEILLKDYQNSKIRIVNIGNYKRQCIVTGILTFLFLSPIIAMKVDSTMELRIFREIDIGLVLFLLMLTFFSALFFARYLMLFFLGRRRYLEISSEYDSIIIQLSPWNISAKKFIKAIETARHNLEPVMK